MLFLRRSGLLSILLISMIVLSIDIAVFLKKPVFISQQSVDYIVKPGTGIFALAKGLHTQHLLKRPLYFIVLATFQGKTSRLKAGEYRIMPGTTPLQLLDQIVQGRVLFHPIKLLEGWTFQQFLAALRAQPRLLQTLQGLSVETIMEKLGHAGEHPEGRFFPDTYQFTAGTTDLAILKQAYIIMQKRLALAWEKREPNVPYRSAYDALIVASLIEKETAVDGERPMVAEVILNRLKKKMLLQIDPTVIYSLGKQYTGKLRKNDLRVDSPYNTYRYAGLPPTPIAMPGAASIQAALHPTEGERLYFVAKGDGGHQFSNTLVEHNQAVKNYILK
jgi:UPF0755 protein